MFLPVLLIAANAYLPVGAEIYGQIAPPSERRIPIASWELVCTEEVEGNTLRDCSAEKELKDTTVQVLWRGPRLGYRIKRACAELSFDTGPSSPSLGDEVSFQDYLKKAVSRIVSGHAWGRITPNKESALFAIEAGRPSCEATPFDIENVVRDLHLVLPVLRSI